MASRTQTLEFHICEKNLEWSSLERWRVESTGSAVRTVQVSGLLLSDILQAYGAPAYIKCDIEGADGEFVRQLTEAGAEQLPSFVSVEGIALSWLHDLERIGFDRAQLVNQARIRRKFDPPFVFDVGGEQREWTFKGHSCGRFGLERIRRRRRHGACRAGYPAGRDRHRRSRRPRRRGDRSAGLRGLPGRRRSRPADPHSGG